MQVGMIEAATTIVVTIRAHNLISFSRMLYRDLDALPYPYFDCDPYRGAAVSGWPPYGAGTLMTVLTTVTGPVKTIALPFSVVTAATPAVDTETAA
jgi:hypothetical protein